MAKDYDALTEHHRKFIGRQHVFFVASAAPGAHVNISPRATGWLRVLTDRSVAYLDRTGSGNETAAHARADAAEDAELRATALRQALALPLPADLPEAEPLRLELAARLCETLAEQPGGVPVALDLLAPMLDPERSLPVDRASARALVVLGDLAVESGDDALAAGSYMRAIRVMSLLRQELER